MASDKYDNLVLDTIKSLRVDTRAGFREVHKKIDNNTTISGEALDEAREARKQATLTNGRVTKLEEAVFAKPPVKARDLPEFWKDPQIIKYFLILAIIIAAGIFGVPKVLDLIT